MGRKLRLSFPSPKTNGKWQFTSQGWVGYIPLTPDLGLALRPKIQLGNIFRMLEYAYAVFAENDPQTGDYFHPRPRPCSAPVALVCHRQRRSFQSSLLARTARVAIGSGERH